MGNIPNNLVTCIAQATSKLLFFPGDKVCYVPGSAVSARFRT